MKIVHVAACCPDGKCGCLCHQPCTPSRDDLFAPSEENVLHCDVRDCDASLSMPNDIPRKWHGWGRISLYSDVGGDLDLCPEHFNAVWAVLGVK